MAARRAVITIAAVPTDMPAFAPEVRPPSVLPPEESLIAEATAVLLILWLEVGRILAEGSSAD